MACKTCRRALLPEHEDKDGNCCYCAAPAKARRATPRKLQSSDPNNADTDMGEVPMSDRGEKE
jgi:hypothetical protein